MRALWEVDHALFSASKRMSSRLGVTGPERLVIRIVGEFPDLTPGDLAAILHLDPSTLTGLLHRLVERRLLSRRTDAADTRKSRLRLTPEGAEVDRVRSGTVEAGVRAALDALAPRDVAATVHVLGALSRVLNGMTFEGVRPPDPLEPRARARRARRA
jgi:DNA-binding MarR family transcriptional regulator